MKHSIVCNIIYVFTALNCVCPNLCFAKTNTPKSIPGTTIFVMSYNTDSLVKTKNLNYKNKNINLSMQIPLFKTCDTSIKKEFNKQMLKESKVAKDTFIKECKAYSKDIYKDTGLLPTFEYQQNYREIETIHPYYTLEVFQYRYEGGAHGISNFNYITFDTLSNKRVTLEDLFKPCVDYEHVLNQLLLEQVKEEHLENQLYSGAAGIPTIHENQPFYINKENQLVIVFNVYELAPYSTGTLYFPISFTKISQYIK